MSARLLILLLVFLAARAGAQGFAGLGTEAEGYASADADRVLVFPEDHSAHPGFRIEWWYVTANLRGADGQDYGVQWTLFRTALSPGTHQGWASPVRWMGHAAVTSATGHLWAERFARGGVGQAGAGGAPFEAWLDDWRLTSRDAGISRIELAARGADFAFALGLTADGPLVLHGAGGYSVKSDAGDASHYYSQPFYRAEGTLTLAGRKVAVTGTAWLDREWSGKPLAAGQFGWDWMGLTLDDGTRVMVGQVHGPDEPFRQGTWIAPDGRTQALRAGDFELEPSERRDGVPVRWRLRIPGHGFDAETVALNPDAWTGGRFRYWEGPVRVTGSHEGRGYLEMTGR